MFCLNLNESLFSSQISKKLIKIVQKYFFNSVFWLKLDHIDFYQIIVIYAKIYQMN